MIRAFLFVTVLYSFSSLSYGYEYDKRDDSYEEPEAKPAFMAVYVPYRKFHLGYHYVMKFTRVVTNIGNCFNKNTGKFTAPQDGEYQFSASFVTGYRKKIHINLMKNNIIVCRGFGTDGVKHATGALSAVLSLKKGDTVYMKNNYASNIFGHYNSMFSGHMI